MLQAGSEEFIMLRSWFMRPRLVPYLPNVFDGDIEREREIKTMFDSIEHVFKIREIFLLKINFGRKKKSCILKRQNSLKMLFLIFLVFGAKLDHVYYYFKKKNIFPSY